MKLTFKDTPRFNGIGPGLNAILRQTKASETLLDLGMTIPQMIMLSVYKELSPKWAVLGNLGWQQGSRFYSTPSAQFLVFNPSWQF